MFLSLHRVIKISVVTFTCTLVQKEYQCIFAQADSTGNTSDNVWLDEVEVSASQPMPWGELARSVSVIEKKEIAASPAQSLDDILEKVPGVDIRQRGSDGVQSDISLNGGSFDQVLILLNGVNITDPQTGHHNLNLPIDLSQIQRIEILRGSGARTLGSNAFCGAINIITTKTPQDKGLFGQADITSGSWGYLKTAASLTYDKSSWQIEGGVSRKVSDGYTDNTDYKLIDSHIQATYHHPVAGNFFLQLGYQQKAFGANGFYSFAYPNQFEATRTLFSALSWNKTLGKSRIQAQLYERRHHDRFELFRDMKNAATWYPDHNYHLTDVTGGNLSQTVSLEHGKTQFGTEVRNEHIFSTILGESLAETKTDVFDEKALYTKGKQRTNVSAFFDQTIYLGKFTLSAGLSGNYNSDHPFYWHGGIDVAWQITERFKSWLSLTRSVRLPSFTDLYYKSAIQTSNQALLPETALTFERGVSWTGKHIRTSASFWYRWGNNLIDWVKAPDSTKWESRNLTKVNALGVNTFAEYVFESHFINGIRVDYTYQHLNKKAEGLDSKYALDYLKHKINLNLSFRLYKHIKYGDVSAVLNVAYYDRAGNYTDFVTSNLKDYVPYWLFDTRLLWSRQSYQLYMDINNLFNTTYADFGGLNQPGTAFKAGIKVVF